MYKKYHAQKRPKICTGCRVSAAKIYIYHSTKIAKARPHRVECPTDSSVQKQWSMHYVTKVVNALTDYFPISVSGNSNNGLESCHFIVKRVHCIGGGKYVETSFLFQIHNLKL